jgi:predicted RNA-binding protein YlqC (UPF0109 family)
MATFVSMLARKAVEKQEILHVISGQCLDKNGRSALAIRIAEVSKNHLNQVRLSNNCRWGRFIALY